MQVLKVDDLQKTFMRGLLRRKTTALHGITFAVEQGEVFGFLGPNGAGKTTAIKILMGLIFPTGGRASVFGAPIGDLRAKARVGYLPENPYFYDYLSLVELLHMVGRIHGLDARTRRTRASALIEQVGLAHAAKRPLRSYSKGMLQRAGLAQALMGDPDLVVLDEPMSGLDPLGRKEVRDLMVELRRRGKTVFFSTHILSDASMLCDRVAIIFRGRLHDVGPLGSLLSPKVYGVDIVWQAPEPSLERLRAFPGVHASTSEGHVYGAADVAEGNRFIAEVLAGQGVVLQVVQHRQTLEQLFVHEATRHQAGHIEASGEPRT